MNRGFTRLIVLVVLVFMASSSVLAFEGTESTDHAHYYGIMAVACAFAMAIASGLCGMAQAKAIVGAMEAIGRQPSVVKDIQTALIISLALIEALGLYTLVVALLLIFQVKPF